LTEFLYQYKFLDTLDKIKELARKGQLKFTGSGMYHPILPLLPTSEIIRQITLNEEYNTQVLGSSYAKPKGFFPPELAISRGVLSIVEKLGYKWILAPGSACPPESEWPIHVYNSYKSLPVLFRDEVISNEISFNKLGPLEFLTKLKNLFDGDYYVITAMDGETYGHHVKQGENFLSTVFTQLEEEEELKIVLIEDLLKLFDKGENIIPINSSWSTSKENLAENNPFPLWADPKNKIHTVLNLLRMLAIQLFQYLDPHKNEIPEDYLEFYNNARTSLDKGMLSDGAWWASFYFSEDLIFRSTTFLLRAVINTYKALFSISMEPYELLKIRQLYDDVKNTYAQLLQLLANQTEERAKTISANKLGLKNSDSNESS
jgi:alpha-amylase/alpha-mannosidase (GH57 family)